jgi:hypothetical protein
MKTRACRKHQAPEKLKTPNFKLQSKLERCKKKEASIIGEGSGKNCAGGKGLAGNSLGIEKRRIVRAMARFV